MIFSQNWGISQATLNALTSEQANHLVPCSMTELEIRDKIDRLEAVMREMDGSVDDLPLKHTFSDGIYAREVLICKGTTAVGKIHKHEHLNIILKGDITVLTIDGLKRIKGPCIVKSPPGTKRAGYAHEDTIWVTIHANPTNETDLGKIEEFTISERYDLLDDKNNNILEVEK